MFEKPAQSMNEQVNTTAPLSLNDAMVWPWCMASILRSRLTRRENDELFGVRGLRCHSPSVVYVSGNTSVD